MLRAVALALQDPSLTDTAKYFKQHSCNITAGLNRPAGNS
jgi:hypothetical protein